MTSTKQLHIMHLLRKKTGAANGCMEQNIKNFWANSVFHKTAVSFKSISFTAKNQTLIFSDYIYILSADHTFSNLLTNLATQTWGNYSINIINYIYFLSNHNHICFEASLERKQNPFAWLCSYFSGNVRYEQTH